MRTFFFIATLLLSFNLHAADRLTLGINPGAYGQEDQWILSDQFQPFADYIGKAAGVQVRTDITQNFKRIENHAGKKSYDLLLANTTVIGRAYQESGYTPVAKFKDLHAVLLVKEQSPYNTIASLKNSRIGIISRKKLMGPLAVDFLQKQGLVLNRDFKQVQELEYQDALLSLLLNGSLDVISVAPKIAADAIKAQPGKLRILANTTPVPGFAISLSRTMPAAQAQKITDALLTISQSVSGKAALAAITIGSIGGGGSSLEKTNGAEYVNALGLISAAANFYPALKK